jgi:hypothetical protein
MELAFTQPVHHSLQRKGSMTECGRESNGRDERDWKKLCAAASEEPDSEKLVSLVHQIIQAFNENDKKNPVAGVLYGCD